MTGERDLHDAAVDAAWRTHLVDEPPRALDDAILAAAHRAVSAPPVDAHRPATRGRWQSWAPLAAAATLAVVAFGVVELAPHDEDRAAVSIAPGTNAPSAANVPPEAPPLVPEAPASASNAPAPASQTPPAASAPAAAIPDAAAKRALRKPMTLPPRPLEGGRAQGNAIAKGEARAPSDAAALMQRDKFAGEGVARREHRAPAQPPVAAAAPQSAAADRGAGASAAIDDYVKRIALLHAQGADDEAAQVLREFRAAYRDADSLLPRTLHAWAQSVPARVPETPPR